MRLQRGAELAVIVEIEARAVAKAERGGRTGVGAIAALTDPLHRDALGAETDHDRAEILRDIVDELAVGGKVEDLLVENEVVTDLGAQQQAGPFKRRPALGDGIETTGLL